MCIRDSPVDVATSTSIGCRVASMPSNESEAPRAGSNPAISATKEAIKRIATDGWKEALCRAWEEVIFSMERVLSI